MPIYEYRCEKCGVFEETQRITDPALERCPTCRRKVRRLISNTSFQLKGGGWYVTDYGRAGQKGQTTGEKSGESSSSGSESSKDAGGSSASSSSTSDGKNTGKKKAETKAASADA